MEFMEKYISKLTEQLCFKDQDEGWMQKQISKAISESLRKNFSQAINFIEKSQNLFEARLDQVINSEKQTKMKDEDREMIERLEDYIHLLFKRFHFDVILESNPD